MGLHQLHDKTFGPYLSGDEICNRIEGLAAQIQSDYQSRKTVFLIILNGAFIFAADLLKRINIQAEISFVKVSSYQGTSSSGKIKSVLGIDIDLKGKDVIIIEDIVDTGLTLDYLLKTLNSHQPSSIEVASLLFKKEAYQKDFPIKYIGFEIPDNFVVGYGLDYNGLGRNMNEILTLKTDNTC